LMSSSTTMTVMKRRRTGESMVMRRTAAMNTIYHTSLPLLLHASFIHVVCSPYLTGQVISCELQSSDSTALPSCTSARKLVKGTLIPFHEHQVINTWPPADATLQDRLGVSENWFT
jgi:hypothetical protein